MATPTLIVYKGPTSQTGQATSVELPGISYIGKTETFSEIGESLSKTNCCAVLPIWNSHQGEIKISNVLELLFQNSAKLLRLWPAVIEWELIRRSLAAKENSVIGVGVAKTQCSKAIAERNLEYVPVESSVEAYERFSKEESLNYAIVAPNQNAAFEVVSDSAANPLNFTSFALLGCRTALSWNSEDQWGDLWKYRNPSAAKYFGVEMEMQPSWEPELKIIKDLVSDVEVFNDIPRLIMAADSKPGKCRLLFEADHEPELPSGSEDEDETEQINLIPGMGETVETYGNRVKNTFSSQMPAEWSHDFIKHQGTESFFCACPPLSLITHGFNGDLVETLFRQLVGSYFRYYVNGVRGTPEHNAFFERHLASFHAGRKFILTEIS